MPAGLQCFDASETLTVDMTDRITRNFDEITLDGNDGSVTNAKLLLGDPFYCIKPLTALAGSGGLLSPNAIIVPDINFVGDTVFWTYPAYATAWGTKMNGILLYGVY